MDMVGDTTNTVAVAVGVAGNGGEIGMYWNFRSQNRCAVLRGEDDMKHHEREGLRHSASIDGELADGSEI